VINADATQIMDTSVEQVLEQNNHRFFHIIGGDNVTADLIIEFKATMYWD